MFYRPYSMSMWEYFYSAGVAGILWECIFFVGIPSRPALKFLIPLPSVPARFPRVPRDSIFGDLIRSQTPDNRISTEIVSLMKTWDEAKRALNKAIRNNSNQTIIQILQQNYRTLRNKTRYEIRKEKKNYINIHWFI
jgi:hypothetical protein